MNRADVFAERKARTLRILQAVASTLAIVQAGVCPICGRALKRNLSIAGWWQCSQFGAVGFRKDPEQPACDWQGFTE
jgi:hypothetical protein